MQAAVVKVHILRTSGTSETHDVAVAHLYPEIERLIGARCLDHVTLRDGRTMWVDDDGYEVEVVEHDPADYRLSVNGLVPAFVVERKCVRARKPVNLAATELYHRVCRPGTTHQIVGDVAICTLPDDDEE